MGLKHYTRFLKLKCRLKVFKILTLFILAMSSLLLFIVCFGGRNGLDFGGIGGMMARWESDLADVGEGGIC